MSVFESRIGAQTRVSERVPAGLVKERLASSGQLENIKVTRNVLLRAVSVFFRERSVLSKHRVFSLEEAHAREPLPRGSKAKARKEGGNEIFCDVQHHFQRRE